DVVHEAEAPPVRVELLGMVPLDDVRDPRREDVGRPVLRVRPRDGRGDERLAPLPHADQSHQSSPSWCGAAAPTWAPTRRRTNSTEPAIASNSWAIVSALPKSGAVNRRARSRSLSGRGMRYRTSTELACSSLPRSTPEAR